MLKILVTGDRNWVDCALVEQSLEQAAKAAGVSSYAHVLVIHGQAHGADTCASYAVNHLHMSQRGYPANWEVEGRAAGPLRNQRMLDENPDIDLVLAFHDDLNSSKGTRDMIRRAKKMDLPILHIYHTIERVWLNEPEKSLVD